MGGASSSKAANAQAKKLSPDYKMDSSPKELQYTKVPGFAKTHGQDYEVILAALLFLRGLNSRLHFQLGTNVQGAGALDDVVFRFKSEEESSAWTTMFVQLKHLETKSLSRKMLRNSKEPFFLTKYFESYLKLKQTMLTERKGTLFDGCLKDCLFVIFTNAKAGDSLGKKLERNFSQAEEFLWSDSGSVFSFETDEDMLQSLGDCGDEGKEFLKQFRVFCCQPSVDDLRNSVKEELAKLKSKEIQDMKIDRLCECYLGNVKVWWEKSNAILHECHDILKSALCKVRLESESAEDRVRLQTCSEQTLKDFVLPVEFEDTALLKFGGTLTHVVSSEHSCRLTLTKLLQATKGQFLVLSCKQLAANKVALLAENRNGDQKSLILCTKDWGLVPSNEYLDVVNEMLANRDTFSLVLLSDGTVSELTERFEKVGESYKDNFKISQLKKESQAALLKKKFNFQGHEVPLITLLNNDYKSLDVVLTASLVVEILENVDLLTVGSALPEGIGYYVKRSLEFPCVKASVFQTLRGTVTIRVMKNDASDSGLFDKALDFVNSLKDSPSFHHYDKGDILHKLFQSLLVPDRNDCEIFTGPSFSLRFYECYCVGLRSGQENAITALHVRPRKDASRQVSFLFVSNETKEEDAKKLSKFYQSVHLLSLKAGQLHWIQSREDIESIRKHLNEDQATRVAPETVMSVEDRLVLVCAEPGMGKSTLMARLAKNTKAALPHYFVIVIALNDHSKLFTEGKHADPLGFLSIAAKMDSPLQQSFLKYALEVSGNVVVVADGFDEIAPRYIEQSCHLLSSLLKQTKTSKIWMTSRNSVKQILEKHFFKFSVKLCEVDKDGQKNFLKKFWAGKASKINLNDFIDHLLEKSAQAIGDKERHFLGIPLQTRMLAEIYEDHVTCSAEKTTLPDKLDLLSLVEKFVDLKYDIYFRDKAQTANFNLHKDMLLTMSRNDFFASHTNAALILILGEEDLKSQNMGWIVAESQTFFNEIKRGAYKTGFIDEIVNDEPRFIHRIFAEYLVANWLAQHFAGNPELVQSKMYTPDFNLIRYFFNGILCKSFTLHTAVLQENVEEVKTLLVSEDVNIAAKDIGGRTALHLAASLGSSGDHEELKRCCEILDLIIGKTSDFNVIEKVLCGSPLRYADITRWWSAIDKLLYKTGDNGQLVLTLANIEDDNMLDTIFKQDLDKLLEFCLDNGLEVEHRYSEWYKHKTRLLVKACKEGTVKVASLLIERNANINFIDNYDKYSDGPLIVASYNGHMEIVKLLYEKYVSSLASPSQCEVQTSETNLSDSSKYINNVGNSRRTAMHHAAEKGHIDVIHFLISHGGDTKSCDARRKTPLHLAAESNKPNAVKVLLEALDEADRVAAVSVFCSDGYSSLHLAARGGSVECVKLLYQTGAKLSQRNWMGETPLMTAIRGGKPEVVTWLLDNFNEDREGMTLVKYMNMKYFGGNTIMHHAAWGGSVDCVKILLQAGGKLSQVDCRGETPLMTAASKRNVEIINSLLNIFDAEQEEISLVDYVNMKDKAGKTALTHAAWQCSLECVKLLVEAGGRLSILDDERETPLMIAAKGGELEFVKWVLNNYIAEREGISLVEYIDLKDKYGRTAKDMAWSGCRELIEMFSK